MTVRSFAALIGAVLVVVGMTGLLWPLKPSTSDTRLTCNNALFLDTMPAKIDLGRKGVQDCEDKATFRRLVFGPVAGIGVIVLAGAYLVRRESAPAQTNSAAD